MATIMDFMSRDHDRLDAIFKDFQGTKDRRSFAEFKTGLQRHIVWEEEILFPLFEERTGMCSGPTQVMRMEHRQIRDCLSRMHDKVANSDTDTAELEKGLLEVLKPHNDKEESVLYPWIDSELNEKEVAGTLERMNNLPPEKYNNCCE